MDFSLLRQQIAAILAELGSELSPESVQLETPQNPEHGDLSSNAAFVTAKAAGKNPRALAEEVVAKLQAAKPVFVSEVSVAGPGFINFKFENAAYWNEVAKISAEYGFGQVAASKRIMVEYGHPNTHKSPHIGHLFSYVAGDSISRLLAANGNEVFRVNYQGDIGPHVAKCIYGWQQLGKQEPETALGKVQHLQECYQLGATAYEESEDAKAAITEINKQIYDPNSEIQTDWLKTRQWCLDFYLEFEKRLGVDQKFHYLESELWKKGMEIVKQKTGEVFEESDGAVIFPGEKYGLHTRVFITKYGTPTYAGLAL
jgi:arginyl-tRNA synthetase